MLTHLFVVIVLCVTFALPVRGTPVQDATARLSNALMQYAGAKFTKGSPAGTAALAVQVTRGHETIRAAIGSRNGTVPAQPNDRFRIGSMSKTFVAATALRMAEDGLLNLEDRAANYLPDDLAQQIANLAGNNGATIHQLLAMQIGIPDYLSTAAFQDRVRANPAHPWTAREAVSFAARLPALFDPGKSVSYSNTNYLLAQLVLEKAGGAPLHALIRRYVLDPLRLANTYTQAFENRADTPSSTFVVGYQDFDGNGVPEDVSAINDGFGLGDGGLISTTQDIATFYRALLLDKTLLKPESLAQMMTFSKADALTYGIGLEEWQTEVGTGIGHAGGVLGFLSLGIILPAADTMVIVLCATAECVPEDVARISLEAVTTTAQADPGVNALISTVQAQMNAEIAGNPDIPGQLLSVIAPGAGLDVDLAAGIVDFESGRTLKAGAAFRIASVTKTFTAAAVLRLVEQGRVDLDASIDKVLSTESIALLKGHGYATDQITVRQLLVHTSGIPDFSNTPAYISANLDQPGRVWTRHDQLAFAVDHAAPVGKPGAQFSYSDTGYILLGEIIERQTDQPLGVAVRILLGYERFGLRDTYWEMQENAPQNGPEIPMAHQYYGKADVTRLLSPTADLYGGGGIVSTTRDLALFYRALLRGEVFEHKETLDTMLTIPKTNAGVQEGMDAAMGIFRLSGAGITCWTHGGFWGVFAMYCPDLDVAVVRSIQQANQERVGMLSVINPIVRYLIDHPAQRR